MKRVVVRGATASHNGILSSKGISIEEKGENDLGALLERLRNMFDDSNIIGIRVLLNGERVDVADIGFICDGDELLLVRESDLLMEASGTTNTDVLELNDATSLASDLEFLGIGRNFDRSTNLTNNESPVVATEIIPSQISNGDWITLNVGGTKFVTCRSTIEMKVPDSMLARMFASENSGIVSACRRDPVDGSYLIDRTATYFEPILNYLRTGSLIINPNVNPEGVYEEAKYFGIDELLPQLESMIEESNRIADECPLSRRDVINAIIMTDSNSELRFQGVNLAGADLSKLDLRRINFKYANMQGCILKGANLSECNLERADLSGAILDSAILMEVKMICANLEKASLKNCRFDDSNGKGAIMEGVNLRNANLEGSQMAKVNLRVATLKHGNMKNCDLRGAVLAGADLEYCNMSGSDLCEANLRGANLKDTLLELMPTPLHMSQTVR